MKCRFCSDHATAVCNFHICEPRIAYPEEVKAGDLVQSTRDLQYYMVEIVPQVPKAGEFIMVRYKLRGKWHTDYLRLTIPVLVLRTEECGSAVCEDHYLDNGRIVCPFHWQIMIEPAPDPAGASEPDRQLSGTGRSAAQSREPIARRRASR